MFFGKKNNLKFKQLFVPTKKSNKKLHVEIHSHYQTHIENITQWGIKENIAAEEAVSRCLSQPEAKPTTLYSEEMRELIKEIWGHLTATQNKRQPVKERSTVRGKKKPEQECIVAPRVKEGGAYGDVFRRNKEAK